MRYCQCGPFFQGECPNKVPVRLSRAEPQEPSDDPGAWTCNVCGFRGFWSGGPHCDEENS
jgi:hypothetical protein